MYVVYLGSSLRRRGSFMVLDAALKKFSTFFPIQSEVRFIALGVRLFRLQFRVISWDMFIPE